MYLYMFTIDSAGKTLNVHIRGVRVLFSTNSGSLASNQAKTINYSSRRPTEGGEAAERQTGTSPAVFASRKPRVFSVRKK